LQAGLRASELIGLRCCDIVLGTGAHIRCEGKGRKHRTTPLRRETVKVLGSWLKERKGTDTDPLFPSIRETRLSRDALEDIVHRHVLTASSSCPSLIGKRVSPHVLRHSTAMELLHHGVDQTVIALWLGHENVETTQVYVHADLRLKEKALAQITAPAANPGRYRPDDKLLAYLESL
jgi:integrase/recombinase XerD